MLMLPINLPPPPPPHCGACSFNSGEAFIHTLPAESMPQGEWAFALRADLQSFDAFSDAELLQLAGQGVETHSVDQSFVLRAGMAYALSDAWTVGADLPFVSNSDLREGIDNGGIPEVEANGDQEGIGDASLFAQWRFHEDVESRTYASLYFGAKLPTGRTDVHSPAGELLEPDHQPGSGSTDGFGGFALSRSFGTSTLAGSVLYTLAGDGSQDSNLGDVLRVNAGWGWTPESSTGGTQWRWMIELNGQWHERMEMDGASDPNSGGFQLFVAPGLRVSWSSHVSWFASVGVPLVQDLDGEQSETELARLDRRGVFVLMALEFTERVEVRRTPAQCFAFVDDFGNAPRWNDQCVALQREGSDVREGGGLVYTYKQGNRQGVMHGEVAERDPPRRLLLRFGDRAFQIEVEFRFDAIPGGTRIEHRMRVEPRSFLMRLLSPLLRREMARQTAKQAQALAAALAA